MGNPAKMQGVVTDFRDHGSGVYGVQFAIPRRYTRFKPGQFLHLTLDAYDPAGGFWPESRVFSIASRPRQDHVAILFSVKGTYTDRMATELRAGREAWLRLPHGEFIVAPGNDAQHTVLVAGGTGIAPFLPLLESMAAGDLQMPGEIRLVYGVRSDSLVLFDRLILQCVRQIPNFEVSLYVEDAVQQADLGLDRKSGRPTIETLVDHVDLGTAAFYLSGPPGMVSNFSSGLQESGVQQRNIITDEWE